MKQSYIRAEHLQLALVARKASPMVRWAAMSNYRWSPRACRPRSSPLDRTWEFPGLLQPMGRGGLHGAIKRQRSLLGPASIRSTFGSGLRALLAEPAHVLPAMKRGAP